MNCLTLCAIFLVGLLSAGYSDALGCGKPAIQGTRVIAGIDAVRGSWPWQILLQFDGSGMCGGALISPQWVVTAAHCVHNREFYPSSFSVVVGEYDRTKAEGSEMVYDVENIFKNENYEPYALNNDISLIKLKRPVAFNKYVSPICLPKDDPPVGTDCYITGWGKIVHPGWMHTVLQQGKLPVVSNEVCHAKNYKNIGLAVTEAMVCGGDGGKTRLSGCHGDSGGPFVCNINGVWELHGAVSHGSSDCTSTTAYTVFARVKYFKKWIASTIKWNS